MLSFFTAKKRNLGSRAGKTSVVTASNGVPAVNQTRRSKIMNTYRSSAAAKQMPRSRSPSPSRTSSMPAAVNATMNEAAVNEAAVEPPVNMAAANIGAVNAAANVAAANVAAANVAATPNSNMNDNLFHNNINTLSLEKLHKLFVMLLRLKKSPEFIGKSNSDKQQLEEKISQLKTKLLEEIKKLSLVDKFGVGDGALKRIDYFETLLKGLSDPNTRNKFMKEYNLDYEKEKEQIRLWKAEIEAARILKLYASVAAMEDGKIEGAKIEATNKNQLSPEEEMNLQKFEENLRRSLELPYKNVGKSFNSNVLNNRTRAIIEKRRQVLLKQKKGYPVAEYNLILAQLNSPKPGGIPFTPRQVYEQRIKAIEQQISTFGIDTLTQKEKDFYEAYKKLGITNWKTATLSSLAPFLSMGGKRTRKGSKSRKTMRRRRMTRRR